MIKCQGEGIPGRWTTCVRKDLDIEKMKCQFSKNILNRRVTPDMIDKQAA